MEDKTLGLLGLMRRAGAIAIGIEHTADVVRAGKVRLLLLSRDAAEHARRKAENLANGRNFLTVELPYSREELAACLGVSGCTAAAVTDLGFAGALMKDLAAKDPERYAAMAQEMERRYEKAARRKNETAACKAKKRNVKRRTEA